jgi:RNA polymerase sigma factor (sigma-70 family)
MMARTAAHPLHHFCRLISPRYADPTADADLLARFVRTRDEAAFEVLLARHGPMVLRVCRAVLQDLHAAEDAFQATFLVLARRARAIRRPHALAAWLHGVARRVALKARAAAARRRLQAPTLDNGARDQRPEPLDQLSARELLAVLDEEAQRLPEVYRLPVLLCGWEGRSQEEAARLLGWTPGSVKGRLERGRKRLQERLARRGLTLSAIFLAMLPGRAAAAVPAALARSTTRAALAFAADKASATGLASAGAVALTKGVLTEMSRIKITVSCVVLLATALAGSITGLGLRQADADQPAQTRRQEESPEQTRSSGKRRGDRERLQGSWKLVAMERGGQKSAPASLPRTVLVFRGDQVVVRSQNNTETADYRLNAGRRPREMEITLREKVTVRFIFKLEKDQLTLCQSSRQDRYPRAFDEPQDWETLTIMVFSRSLGAKADLGARIERLQRLLAEQQKELAMLSQELEALQGAAREGQGQ